MPPPTTDVVRVICEMKLAVTEVLLEMVSDSTGLVEVEAPLQVVKDEPWPATAVMVTVSPGKYRLRPGTTLREPAPTTLVVRVNPCTKTGCTVLDWSMVSEYGLTAPLMSLVQFLKRYPAEGVAEMLTTELLT